MRIEARVWTQGLSAAIDVVPDNLRCAGNPDQIHAVTERRRELR